MLRRNILGESPKLLKPTATTKLHTTSRWFRIWDRAVRVRVRTFQQSGDPGNCGSNSDRALITGTPSRSGSTSTKNLAALSWNAEE